MITRDIKDRYINPYTDFGFKKLFGTEMNKELLISFINSLLHGREQIKKLTYLNTEHLGTGESDRRAVFDVYCENEYGEKFLVAASSSSSRTAACITPHFPSANRPAAATGTTSCSVSTSSAS